ncbi:hypothetical protein HPB47_005952, partial [Ixodes persulcatus]
STVGVDGSSPPPDGERAVGAGQRLTGHVKIKFTHRPLKWTCFKECYSQRDLQNILPRCWAKPHVLTPLVEAVLETIGEDSPNLCGIGCHDRVEDPKVVVPISSLGRFSDRWTIRARVTHKSSIHPKDGLYMFSVELRDESAEINTMVMSNRCCKWLRFYERIQLNKFVVVKDLRHTDKNTAIELSLHMCRWGHIEVNPDLPEAHSLREWWLSEERLLDFISRIKSG